ncbi:MAG: hypothetical protein J7L88_04585, partial [Thermoplasmata archaeon]|nr:hypothetical protein [Thermoplasmata archaeon]
MSRVLEAEYLIQFPSCEVKPRERLALTPAQRRAAVRILAERGVEGIDELLNDLQKDEEFERWVKRYREEYMKERERRLKELKERMRRELARLRRRREELDTEVRLLRFSEGEIRGLGVEDELIAALEVRYRGEEERLSLLERIILFFKRIVMAIRSALAWLKRFLFGRERRGVKREEVKVAVKSLRGRFARLKSTLDERLFKDPLLQEEVDRKLVERWGRRGERIVKKKYEDREEYRRAAERVLKEILEE